MKLGIIIETNDPEKSWNAFRFGVAALKAQHDVKIFLMGEAVECEYIENEHFDTPQQMSIFEKDGGILLACGTCLKSRQLDDVSACPISTMNDCVDMVAWADKVVTF